MDVWKEVTKKREGPERFVASGLGVATAGGGMWLLAVVTDRDDAMRTMAVPFVVVGLLFVGIGIAMALIAFRKRDQSEE